MPAARYKEIVKQHRPAGYKLSERRMNVSDGRATFVRRITVRPIEDRHSLAVFLHECGHVHHQHVRDGVVLPTWRMEYEADQYAIKALRAANIPMPRDTLAHWKQVVREYIHGETVTPCDDEDVLRYAYGKDWRKHR